MNQEQNNNPMNNKQQVIDVLKKANNVLVTVSQNPSVDQLASCIGLSLILNKLNKHATAIFSGTIPSTIEFLQPEKMLETNTDSLRDFIISLDRSRADKLRYKVEDNVVRIFITPYRTSLSQNDLEFSQGDFNVDVVIALGVDQREHLDLAIMQQGRILHDATVIGLSAGEFMSSVGAINMHDSTASSISEIVAMLADALQGGLLDEQIATALLTGIVAETDRFRNEKTSARVMSISSQLMSAGANQQLIAQKISTQGDFSGAQDLNTSVLPSVQSAEGPEFDVPKEGEAGPKEAAVSLHVDPNAAAPAVELPGEESDDIKKINIDEAGNIHDDLPGSDNQLINKPHKVIQPLSEQKPTSNYIYTPPTRGGTLTASNMDNSMDEKPNPTVQAPPQTPLINRDSPLAQNDNVLSPELPAALGSDLPEPLIPQNNLTSSDSNAPEPPVNTENPQTSNPESMPGPDLNQEDARKAVLEAVAAGGPPLTPAPVAALNAQPIDLGNQPQEQPAQVNPAELPPPPLPPPITPMPEPPGLSPVVQQEQPSQEQMQPQPQQGNTPFNLPPPQ